VHYALSLPPLAPAIAPAARATVPGAAMPEPMALAATVAARVRITSAGTACQVVEMHVRPPAPPRTATTVELAYECPRLGATLHLRDDLFDLTGRDQHTLVRFDGEDGPRQVMLDSTSREAAFATGRPDPSIRADSVTSEGLGITAFLGLGVEHILVGWDHLLFLLALILPGVRVGELVRTVTAFTIAHSITLGLSATGHLTVPVAPVEALIALSIAWVAAQNLTASPGTTRRWVLAFVFGLVHGFGFSTVLREIGLPTDARLLALLNFNLGVEVGQLLVVLALLPPLRWLRSQSPGGALVQGLSGIVLVCGSLLFVARLAWPDGG
jgi:hydrogenase/urease accessory protein HupE